MKHYIKKIWNRQKYLLLSLAERGKRVNILLLFLCIVVDLQAQFTPNDPPEPQVPVFYYPLTVACEPVGAGYVSGKGNYASGNSVTVSTSPKSGYTFSHWKLNGVQINNPASFSYTTIEGPMNFVAYYNLSPVDPSEPTMEANIRLYLIANPTGVCTFNRTSGAFVLSDSYVTVNVTNIDQYYEFIGWYQDGTLVSSKKSFNYLAGYTDATLEARFRELPFTPSDPSDPISQGGDIQTLPTGDANGDGSVDVTDAVAVINAYLTSDISNINKNMADVNKDGVIDITDAVAIINLYLKGN